MSDLHEEMESDEASDEECSFVDPFPNCRLSELVAQILGEDYVDKEKKEEENEYTNDPFENAHDVPTTFISYLGDFKYLFREPLPSIEESEFEDELAEETEISQQTHIQNAFEPKSALAIGEDKNENKSCVIDTGELNVSNENFTSPSSEVEIATQTEPIQLDFDTDENNCIVRNNMIQSLDGETLSVEIESDKTHVKSHTVNNEDIDKEHGNASVNQNSCEDGLVCTKFSWSVTMAEYKLYYFSLRGRGQAMRYIFADKGIDYETINIGPEWRTKYKQTMPFGQAPLLQHGDFKIAQSNAILRYLGRQLDLYPTDVKEMAMVDMVSDHIEDIRLPYARMIYQDYENGKDDYIKTLPEKLGYLENLMKNWGNEFITSKITVVDYNLLDLLEILTVLSPTCLDAFTTLKGFVAKMQARPGISKYQNTQEFKDMPINGNGKQ